MHGVHACVLVCVCVCVCTSICVPQCVELRAAIPLCWRQGLFCYPVQHASDYLASEFLGVLLSPSRSLLGITGVTMSSPCLALYQFWGADLRSWSSH